MKVALVVPSIKKYGWGTYCYNLANELSKKVDLCTFSLDTREGINFVNEKIPNLYVKDKSKVSNFTKKISISLKIVKKIKSGFDIYHSVDYPFSIFSFIKAKLNRRTSIITGLGTFASKPLGNYGVSSWLLKKAYENSINTFLSEYTRDQVLKKVECKNFVIYPGVSYEKFQKVNNEKINYLRRMYGNNVLLGVGGLIKRKGFDITIKSLKIVKKKFPNVKYLIIGDGPERKNLLELVKNLNLQNNVKFLGEMINEEIIDFYHFCDIYVHTPVIVNGMYEGFGIVYLEASACGKPCIGSNSGGVPSAVINGVTGLLAKEGDIYSTANCIIKLLKDEKLRNKLGSNGKKRAKKLTWENMAKKYIKIYKNVMKGKKYALY